MGKFQIFQINCNHKWTIITPEFHNLFHGTCNISFCSKDLLIREQAWWIVNKIFAERCVQFWGLGGRGRVGIRLSRAADSPAGNLSRDTKYRINLSPLDVSPGQT